MIRIWARHCSQAATKAEAKISWNKENKQLYGEVIKTKKSRKKNDKPAQTKIVPETPREGALSSEMHWMLGSVKRRTRMFAPLTDTTERVALRVQHPKERFPESPSNGFAEILRVPLIYSGEESSSQLPSKIADLEQFDEVPSVGKILQATMSDGARNALIKWKLGKIEELGEAGFQELQKANLSRGLSFHNLLQDYFTREEFSDLEDSDPNYPVWKSVQAVLPEIERQALLVEKRVVHPVLRYKGVVDCVSRIGSTVYGIEWKNSEKSKSTLAATFDAPLQLCAYLGALNASRAASNTGSGNSSSAGVGAEIAAGMVVVAYQNGRPADYYKLDEVQLQKYWYAWLLRVQEYWIRSRDGTLPEPIF